MTAMKNTYMGPFKMVVVKMEAASLAIHGKYASWIRCVDGRIR